MISSETAGTVRTSTAGTNQSYTIGFSYFKNTNGAPQIMVQVNSLTASALVWGTDYTLSSDGLNIIIASDIGADKSIYITRNIPKVQLSDYTIGRIDPEQIEKSFDLITEITQQEALNTSRHITNISNPHSVTKAQVGLGNVDNTSDYNKPISTATQIALNGKQATLTAGSNITISGTTISATDTKYTAGDNITIVGNVISATGGGATYTAGDNITITNNVISATDTTYTAGTGLSLTGTAFSADTTVLATKSDLLEKQDTLTAGDNITIDSSTNTISATDTTYTAGSNITIVNNEISATDTTYTAGSGLTLTGTSFSADTTVLATKTDITNMQSTINLVTSLSGSSTDSQYPSAKCVYDLLGNIETAINTIRGI